MSLNEINLPPQLVAQLFSRVLISNNTPLQQTKKQPDDEPAADWKFLGNNQQQILIVVEYTGVPNLPDEQLDFLTQLLKACRLSLNDVAIINLNNYINKDAAAIIEHLKINTLLLFGFSTKYFGLPFDIPQYQVQKFNNYTILHAPALHDLQNDKPSKAKLWASLKNIFNV
ncbi:MAG: hypothetical protein QM640_06990 [Niabella sp.]